MSILQENLWRAEGVHLALRLTTLQEYEKIFGRNNLHILFYEDITNHPDD